MTVACAKFLHIMRQLLQGITSEKTGLATGPRVESLLFQILDTNQWGRSYEHIFITQVKWDSSEIKEVQIQHQCRHHMIRYLKVWDYLGACSIIHPLIHSIINLTQLTLPQRNGKFINQHNWHLSKHVSSCFSMRWDGSHTDIH